MYNQIDFLLFNLCCQKQPSINLNALQFKILIPVVTCMVFPHQLDYVLVPSRQVRAPPKQPKKGRPVLSFLVWKYTIIRCRRDPKPCGWESQCPLTPLKFEFWGVNSRFVHRNFVVGLIFGLCAQALTPLIPWSIKVH